MSSPGFFKVKLLLMADSILDLDMDESKCFISCSLMLKSSESDDISMESSWSLSVDTSSSCTFFLVIVELISLAILWSNSLILSWIICLNKLSVLEYWGETGVAMIAVLDVFGRVGIDAIYPHVDSAKWLHEKERIRSCSRSRSSAFFSTRFSVRLTESFSLSKLRSMPDTSLVNSDLLIALSILFFRLLSGLFIFCGTMGLVSSLLVSVSVMLTSLSLKLELEVFFKWRLMSRSISHKSWCPTESFDLA
ncbi:hypothetical protein BpHYR1_039771 [Brachionus plicatilis]|uniref:Uncharacterized protein n=1 Tax=Brachionus plicatilis TaxID=10195 RepID=A0A3M7SL22_BRAPC|nr:hypothetical protein BpHYR1_039771 [Brachionus plicatilis]